MVECDGTCYAQMRGMNAYSTKIARLTAQGLLISAVAFSPSAWSQNSLFVNQVKNEQWRVEARFNDRVSGIQFTLTVPAGLSIKEARSTELAADGRFMVAWHQQDPCTVKVVVLGRTLQATMTGSLNLLSIVVEKTGQSSVSGDLMLSNVVISDPVGKGINVVASGAQFREIGGVEARSSVVGNFPNPFNPSTTLSYTVAQTDHIRLTVYDLLGREVANLVDEVVSAGDHQVRWLADSRTVSAGVYFARLEASGSTSVHRMILTR